MKVIFVINLKLLKEFLMMTFKLNESYLSNEMIVVLRVFYQSNFTSICVFRESTDFTHSLLVKHIYINYALQLSRIDSKYMYPPFYQNTASPIFILYQNNNHLP